MSILGDWDKAEPVDNTVPYSNIRSGELFCGGKMRDVYLKLDSGYSVRLTDHADGETSMFAASTKMLIVDAVNKSTFRLVA